MKPPAKHTTSESQRIWWSSPGLVYFFAAGNPPRAVKIGVTAIGANATLYGAVTQRFRAIQTHNHERVELLGVIRFSEGEMPTRDAEVLERELHLRFALLQRFRAHTRGAEWFTPSEELLHYIAEHATPPETLHLPRTIAVSPEDHPSGSQ